MRGLVGVVICFVVLGCCALVQAKEYKCINVSNIVLTEASPDLRIINVGNREFLIEVNKKTMSDFELLKASLEKQIPGCICIKTKPGGGTVEEITAVGEDTGAGKMGCVY